MKGEAYRSAPCEVYMQNIDKIKNDPKKESLGVVFEVMGMC